MKNIDKFSSLSNNDLQLITGGHNKLAAGIGYGIGRGIHDFAEYAGVVSHFIR